MSDRSFRLSFKIDHHPKVFFSSVILSFGAGLGILFQDNLFQNYLFSLAALALFFPVLFLLAGLAASKLWLGRKIGKRLSWSLVIGLSANLSVCVFVALGWQLDVWRNEAVRSYVDQAVPILDQIKKESGSYPLLLPVSQLGRPPLLLRNFGEYKSDGKEFYFVYVNEPAGWAGAEGALLFKSSDRKWSYDR